MSTSSADQLLARLLDRDCTLWPPTSVAPNRLGWLESPIWMKERADELTTWASTVAASKVLLLGMGGSSLGPLVLAGRDGRGGKFASGVRSLIVADTTDPSTIGSLDFDDTIVIISSKSGSTLETDVLFDFALDRVGDPKQFVIVTDANSPLAQRGAELGVSRVFENPSDIGGRFSLFSYFGMVPAALLGYDVSSFCAAAIATDLGAAAALGEGLGIAVGGGQDKLFITSHPDVPRFGLWAEQLIAESTGKDGTGCIPVPTKSATSSADRFVLSLPFDDAADLAQAFFGLEVAIAICGSVLGVDPFNEPNVTESKERTLDRLSGFSTSEIPTIELDAVNDWLMATLGQGSYLTVQAYVPFEQERDLEELRDQLAARYRPIAVTAGFGPRYLHSTGQLHKGGPDSIVALQVIGERVSSLPIPGRSFDFNTLLAAQADGDYDAVVARNRTVARVVVSDVASLLRIVMG